MKLTQNIYLKILEVIIISALFLIGSLIVYAEGGVSGLGSNSKGGNAPAAIATTASWYHPSWHNRIKITMNASEVDNDLDNFVLYTNLADLPEDFHTNVRSDGGDIRVTKSDGKTELAREVVAYNSVTDTGELYFKNPGTLSGATNTDFYIYYGNLAAKDYGVTKKYGRNNVWTDYEAVYHLEDELDSTGNGHTLNQQGTTTFATSLQKLSSRYADFGALGGNSLYRDGDNYGLLHTDAQSWSFWYKLYTLPENNSEFQLFAKASENNGTGGYGWYLNRYYYSPSDLSLYWVRMNSTSLDAHLTETVTLATSTWYHLAQTFDGVSTNEGWSNGASKGTWNSSGFYSSASDQGFRLGGWWVPTSIGTLRGAIDEFRLFHGAYPAGWVTTEYNNQNSSNTFYSIEAVETN